MSNDNNDRRHPGMNPGDDDFLAAMCATADMIRAQAVEIRHLLRQWDADVAGVEQSEPVAQIGLISDALFQAAADTTDLVRIERGTAVVEEGSFRIEDLIDRFLAVIADRTEGRNIRTAASIVPMVHGDMPTEVVIGDPVRLLRIMEALAEVAFSSPGLSSLHLRVIEISVVGDRWRFELCAEGVDASAELPPPAHAAPGLTLARRFADALGGSMHVVPALEDVGTTRFVLDVALKHAPEPGLRSIGPAGSNRRALICGGDTAERAALGDILTLLGFRASSAETGEDALALLTLAEKEGEAFSVAIINESLTDADGPSLCRCIRLSSDGRDMKLLLAGGRASRSVARHAIEAGFDGTVAKPIRPASVRRSLARAYGIEALHREKKESGKGPNGNRSVLVAERNHVSRLLTAGALKMASTHVETAADGAAAVEAIGRGPYDMILLDLDLEGVGGAELARRIRAADAPPPRLIAIADQLPADCGHALEHFDQILLRPIDASVIVRLLESGDEAFDLAAWPIGA